MAAMSEKLPDEKIDRLRELCRKHGGMQKEFLATEILYHTIAESVSLHQGKLDTAFDVLFEAVMRESSLA